MLPHHYLSSLTLAERLHRQKPEVAGQIYSPEMLHFLRDGVIIFPQVIDSDLLDRIDADLDALPRLAQTSLLHGMIGIDGKVDHYEARVLRNLPKLGITDLRQAGPGLKLNDLHRYFDSARDLAFSEPIIRFLDELFGSAPALIQSLTFWKSSEQSLHQDFSYVHHHKRLGHLAAAWIPLEDISDQAGPLVYYKGSHLLEGHQFYDWHQGGILASRDTDPQTAAGYGQYLETLIRQQGWSPSIYLPRRGDLLIWHGALIHGGTPMGDPSLTRRSYVCHYTAAANHKALARHRVGEGVDFSEPPTLPEMMRPRSLPSRLVSAAGRRMQQLFREVRNHA
ncbi:MULTISPECIES: phytanoyl-CoA dioxygenase family protein [unclassified Cyanobium]|uniref:phytanoyl-CoA dioxygenase family protein n=1 Tax=unclassified Cyanobium TaxID=2627006 RepID=UPI0020CE8441|nr:MULTISPECIES: phytanoyl-CoA dioxygenase family protein [unclassified Cyanobium]MCP9858709.1 phytanoyl-CoA dioxygenase family protein [Cyanobium sp. Cruz-8H5]MCP9865908.1 phytanoyl-CoA dioxygenase family protein [Cyanobium sp. Cruz-8D1]